MEINDPQSKGNWTDPSSGNGGTKGLPGDQAWSKRDQADDNEVNGVPTSRGKLREKGRTYRTAALKERREKINGRMMRKCSIIENLLFSNKNRTAVEEELVHFNNLFKMLLRIHEEYSQVLDDDEIADEDD